MCSYISCAYLLGVLIYYLHHESFGVFGFLYFLICNKLFSMHCLTFIYNSFILLSH